MVKVTKNNSDIEYLKRHVPHLRKNIKPTEAQLQKFPGLVYIIQFGDGKKTMIFGPKATAEERKRLAKERQEQLEHEEFLKKTEDDIMGGSQKQLSAYFAPKKQPNEEK